MQNNLNIERSVKLDLRSVFIHFFVACFVQFILLRQFNIDIMTSLLDAFSTNILMIFAVFALQRIVNSFLSKSVLALINFEIILAMTALIVLGSYFFVNALVSVNPLSAEFKIPYILTKAVVVFLQLFVAHYQFWFGKNQIRLERSLEQKLGIERELQKSELDRIEQTIQPHFLFNSLNSISALMSLDANEAQRMLHLLSDYLRQMVRKEKNVYCSLSDEIDQVRLYLEIEKIRFKERLDVHYEIDAEALEFQIPVFVMQPLIENAVKYGLYGSSEKVDIRIKAELLNEELLQISISNPFDAATKNAQKGEGFGLSSIRKKLNLLFHRNDLLTIDEKDELFKIALKLPQP